MDISEAADRIAGVIDEIRPDTVVTFGPDGLTGHDDHRAVSGWVDVAVRRVASPPRVLHAVVEDGTHQRLARLTERFDASVAPGLPLTLPREALAIHLELDDAVLERKLVALRAHATQTLPVIAALGEDDYRRWVAVESFVAAPAP